MPFIDMLDPVLKAVRKLGGSARPREVYATIAEDLALTPEVLAERLAGGQLRYQNEIGWARWYLVRAGYLDSSRRGIWSFTEQGRVCGGLSMEQAEELVRQVHRETRRETQPTPVPAAEGAGDEAAALGEAEDSAPPGDDDLASSPNYRKQTIQVLQALTPSAFERFCQRLLREAGFQNVTVIGRSGDGGIDGIGILQVNTLVSFKVLFQCKRYVDKVGSPEVRNFRGAMCGRADKGIILTTGAFTDDATREAVRDGVAPIELVDGDRLVDMLEQLEIGLLPVKAYRVDEPFFASFGRVVGEGGPP